MVLTFILHFTFYIFNCLLTGCATIPKAPPKPKIYLEVSASEYKPAAKELTVTFIDVGQGDSIFIKTPTGKNILIDSGGTPYWKNSDYDPGEEVVVPYLTHAGVESLDCVVATHADGDHIGGMPAVLKGLPAKIIYENGFESDQPEKEALDKIVGAKKIPTAVARQSDSIQLDPSLQIDILNPPKDFYFDSDNDNAITIRLVYGDVSFLFTADIEFAAEDEIAKLYGDKIRSNILKVGHHGSATSTSDSFLKIVDPEAAVISVGKYNNFGHPYSGTIAKLQDADVHIYRTDEDGNITVKTDGKKFLVKCGKTP